MKSNKIFFGRLLLFKKKIQHVLLPSFHFLTLIFFVCNLCFCSPEKLPVILKSSDDDVSPVASRVAKRYNEFFEKDHDFLNGIYPFWLFSLESSQSLPETYSFHPVWSRGYPWLMILHADDLQTDYFNKSTEELVDEKWMASYVSKAKKVLWLRSGSHKKSKNDIATFASCCLDLLAQPVVLITTDGDSSIPSDLLPGVYEKIMAHPNIKSWYTQNRDQHLYHRDRAKLKAIPIGFDLHFLAQSSQDKLDKIILARTEAKPFSQRRPSILMDATSYTNPERAHLKNLIENIPVVDILEKRQSFQDVMKLYASYQFVVSPQGNGRDCHRTWELLALGSIPIVHTSSLDILYDDLPVVIVNDWSELKDPHFIDYWSSLYKTKIAYPPSLWLSIERWLPADIL